MRIIGIDPGYAIVGWGIIDFYKNSFNLIDFGVIITNSSERFSSRLQTINYELLKILNNYNPGYMSIEKLYFSSNKKTAIDVAQARGVLLLCGRIFGLSIFEYSPVQVKKAITGYGRANKKQVMEMVKRILNLKEIPKPDDAADALALAVAHGHCGFSRLFYIEENI